MLLADLVGRMEWVMMEGFTVSAIIGWFLGFAFGVGCALAVMYAIYTSGYRRAVLDTLSETNQERYQEAERWALKKASG